MKKLFILLSCMSLGMQPLIQSGYFQQSGYSQAQCSIATKNPADRSLKSTFDPEWKNDFDDRCDADNSEVINGV